MVMTFKNSYSQWTTNAQGNMSNTNTGSIILSGTLDQRNLNPWGGPLDPNGGITAQVNANLGGFIIQSAANNTSVMNMFWGQNFDYHNNGDIRYRINGPAAQQQMVNGSHYFYTAPSGTAQQQITTFAFQPKFSIVNNGGVAVGTNFAMSNSAGQGILTVENNIGLGTQSLAAQLHTTGTVRFQGLTSGGNPTDIVSIDANGDLWRSSFPSGGGIQSTCSSVNFVPITSNTNGNLSCSQIYDDGTSVGIGVSSGFSYTWPGGLTGSNLPPSSGTLKLAIDGVTSALAYFATSDQRYKKNITKVNDALSKIKTLQGVTYQWDKEKYPQKHFNDVPQIGFIAQDVEKVIPEAVIKDKDGYYAMNYSIIIPLLNEGIKEQQVIIDEMKSEIAQLKNDINNLKNSSPNKVKDNYFSVSPNPFNHATSIKYNLPNNISNAIFFVYDLQGKIIKQIKVPQGTISGTLTLTKENLSSGIYFISVSANNKELQTEKAIIVN